METRKKAGSARCSLAYHIIWSLSNPPICVHSPIIFWRFPIQPARSSPERAQHEMWGRPASLSSLWRRKWRPTEKFRAPAGTHIALRTCCAWCKRVLNGCWEIFRSEIEIRANEIVENRGVCRIYVSLRLNHSGNWCSFLSSALLLGRKSAFFMDVNVTTWPSISVPDDAIS